MTKAPETATSEYVNPRWIQRKYGIPRTSWYTILDSFPEIEWHRIVSIIHDRTLVWDGDPKPKYICEHIRWMNEINRQLADEWE
jgi:hypothetical protein